MDEGIDDRLPHSLVRVLPAFNAASSGLKFGLNRCVAMHKVQRLLHEAVLDDTARSEERSQRPSKRRTLSRCVVLLSAGIGSRIDACLGQETIGIDSEEQKSRDGGG